MVLSSYFVLRAPELWKPALLAAVTGATDVAALDVNTFDVVDRTMDCIDLLLFGCVCVCVLGRLFGEM